RQHPGPRPAAVRRPVGRRSRLLPDRRRDRVMAPYWKILIPAGFAAYFLVGMAQLAEAAEVANAPAAYREHCASCHGEARLGGIGPALIPDNLARLRQAEAEQVVRDGRPATQMPAFADKLSAAEVKALVDYVYTPV